MTVVFGTYKPIEKETDENKPISGYFIKGWWTDENNNPISEAFVDDIVKFHKGVRYIPPQRL